jgi:phosphoribosylaminoimidazolecarboxamide formyltransferase / IMP cyclohydrolase
MMDAIQLKYGCNPHQKNAGLEFPGAQSPLRVINGMPSYVNALDALAAWQLARELKEATGLPSAASFKHLSPAGAAVAKPLSAEFRRSQFLGEAEMSPIATAYARARGGDRMCSYGDAIGVSDEVDESLAKAIKGETSDLVIAPSYSREALEILKRKKDGTYLILQIDPAYEPPALESREVFGFTLRQDRNSFAVDRGLFTNAVTKNAKLTEDAALNLIVATIGLKYAQSNSISVAFDGQLIGVGAGQQSRVHCVRLACGKADKWFLQQHPKTLSLQFAEGLKKFEKANIVDQYLLRGELSPNEERLLLANLKAAPEGIGAEEREAFIRGFRDVCLSSDAFFPFRDSIDRADRSNVRFIAQTGGSLRDEGCTAAADEYGMVMFHTGVRLFTH